MEFDTSSQIDVFAKRVVAPHLRPSGSTQTFEACDTGGMRRAAASLSRTLVRMGVLAQPCCNVLRLRWDVSFPDDRPLFVNDTDAGFLQ